SAQTTAQFCEGAENVVGLKDATGNIVRCQELVRLLGDRLAVMSGDDGLTLGMMAAGARGGSSVTANVVPRAVRDVSRILAAGKLLAARAAHLRLLEIHRLMFVEPNPAPAKVALSCLGRMNASVRL